MNITDIDAINRMMKDVDRGLVHIATDYVLGKEPYNMPCGLNQKSTPVEFIEQLDSMVNRISSLLDASISLSLKLGSTASSIKISARQC